MFRLCFKFEVCREGEMKRKYVAVFKASSFQLSGGEWLRSIMVKRFITYILSNMGVLIVCVQTWCKLKGPGYIQPKHLLVPLIYF